MSALTDVTPEIIEDVDQEAAVEPPFRVLIHNDDVTPMEFVVMVLTRIFQLTLPEAEQVMLIAHFTGIAHVAT
ncbi:MAG: ATP-dependent Clp protease adaptor ClpS, partial [Chloroflexi bacterium]|nr:ATP-dependent Clp protease adaptor ClpS [Chloroflexota bacterium]